MVVLPLALIVLVAILLVWMLHTVTVYALPFFAGWGAATLAFYSGAALEDAAIVGVAAGVGTFVSLRFVLGQMADGPARSTIALILILPSLIVGYNIGIDVLEGVVPSEFWRQIISFSYALIAGWIAFVRLTEAESSNS